MREKKKGSPVLRTKSRAFARRTLDVVFPKHCVLCGEILEVYREGEMCDACIALYEQRVVKPCPVCGGSVSGCFCSRHRIENLGVEVASIGFYENAEDQIGQLIYSFKRNYSRDLTRFFARSLAARIFRTVGQDAEGAIVTYPPRSVSASQKYGFDHAKYLARETAKYLGATFDIALVRRGGTEQKKLDAASRAENVAGVFALRPGLLRRSTGERGEKDGIAGRRVILIDDVSTTGATLAEAAKVLREGGAADVRFAALFLTAERAKEKSEGIWFEDENMSDTRFSDADFDLLSDDVGF